mmetsp:Transcript_62806/g.187266  ORF Transcript_62806/g.187266 Transcript_62806/m.187266 type:complete len:288 (+) Transcript_62806:61-924(+)
MDDLAEEADQGDGSSSSGVLMAVAFIHIAVIVLVGWACTACCCPKARPKSDRDEAITIGPEHLQPKKRLLTSYFLWLFCGPLANAHHFYLGRVVHGLLGVWTMNFFCVGWLADAVFLPYYVYRCNARSAAPTAPYDSSIRRLCRLPILFIVLLLFLAAVVLYLPTGLHRLRFVDLDRMAAQTEANPYDVLGVARGADLAEAKSAYRKASLRWHPDRNIGCGKPCEKKMSEITKAFDLIKRRLAPVDDRTWGTWWQELGQDWMNIISAFNQEEGQGSKADESQGKTDL